MKMDTGAWSQEQAHLEYVLDEARSQLEIAGETARVRRAGALESKRHMAENASKMLSIEDTWPELMFHINETHVRRREADFAHAQARRLKRILDAPYFGRIDFREEGQETVETLYIGLAALTRSGTGKHMVLDWRAPVCSMYYDYEPGPAAYRCQAGTVSGELALKRQYRISRGRLQGMFESSVHIADQVLQEILSRNASRHMRAIVTSIQREQNRIIRDEDHPVLIVQGPAGSGKTSIALQRAAYLLYRHRGEVEARHIVAFLPNRLMNEYTSDVMPELGEERIGQTTFFEHACRRLHLHQAENPAEQMEYLLGPETAADDPIRRAGIRFKASQAFVCLLDNCLRHMTEAWAPWQTVSFWGTETLNRDVITRLIREEYSFLPLARRLEQVRNRIMYLIGPAIHEIVQRINQMRRDEGDEADAPDAPSRKLRLQLRQEVARLRQEVDGWVDLDPRTLYRRLFADDAFFQQVSEGIPLPDEIGRIREFTGRSLNAGRVLYEDLAALLYLKGALEGAPNPRDTRHVIIDEAQDYSWLHFRVFAQEFPRSSFTILGDIAQALYPDQCIGPLSGAAEMFEGRGGSYAVLGKRYRSTREIAAFSAALAGPDDTGDYVDRPGERPCLVCTSQDQAGAVADDIVALQGKGAQSIAVICRTARQAGCICESLGRRVSVQAVLHDEESIDQPVIALPVYLAKGLEFDAVIVMDAHQYGGEERKLLFAACTRALHVLHLYSEHPMPALLQGIDEGLYERKCP